MKNVYGYIRVSTVKQGKGVSLQEQKEAIIRYAAKHDLNILKWFKEQETAAKQGRPLFNQMLKLLQAGKASGVVIHKIDRSARNLKDWAVIGDLIDRGIEVHFANESLDMRHRGGRLSADIQAVIAADYIRNLREETIKGLYGRLKQGIYPFGAPLGYQNKGKGKVKTIDPILGPLVRKAYELYAEYRYSLKDLCNIMFDYGLKTKKAAPFTPAKMSIILNNPFYAGILKVKGKTFQGKHKPLIPVSLFNKVQDILRGKLNTRIIKNDFLFRRMLKCAECGYSMIGEEQKGHIYYRCHIGACPTKGVREDYVTNSILKIINDIQITNEEAKMAEMMLEEARGDRKNTEESLMNGLKLNERRLMSKTEKLSDMYIEEMIDKETYEKKRQRTLLELQGIRNRMKELSNNIDEIFDKAAYYLELLKSLKNSYETAENEEKREILKTITSNLSITGKKPMFTILSPFQELLNRVGVSEGAPDQNTPLKNTLQIANNDKVTSLPGDSQGLRKQMKQLVDIILTHTEKEAESLKDDEEAQAA